MRRQARSIIALTAACVALPSASFAQTSVVGSPHDLSVLGPTDIHAIEEDQVCIFCHAPHHASGQPALCNRYNPPTHYRIYQSSTTDARINQPTGPSKMCLSCHDGALALGLVVSRGLDEPIVMSRRRIPPGESDLTHDLSDDHPIGFRYDRALYNRDRQLKNPDIVTPLLPMGRHNTVHCTTCHDPHDNSLGNFLRLPDQRSAICLSCHELDGWLTGSHARSVRPTVGRQVDPGERLPYSTVSENACSGCHKVHSARARERLLRFQREEDNCLNCHNGGVARKNLGGEIRKRSAHRVQRFNGRHDPAELIRTMPRHVECVDCHNPHATRSQVVRYTNQPDLGLVGGTMREVNGINRFGRLIPESRYEYEVCFKCHADTAARNASPFIVRQITQLNTRLQTQPGNPSYHPVIGPRNNPEVVSLRPPWRIGSLVRCTNCHNSDTAALPGNQGVNGPHGSIYEPLLIANYDTAEFVTESATAYALCYQCHERTSILSNESFLFHSRHIVGGRSSCSACHDPHGISRTQGSSRNHSNLINFDLSVVRPVNGSTFSGIEFVDLGRLSGSCTLVCHGFTHVNTTYGPNAGGLP